MSRVKQYISPKTGEKYPIGGCIVSSRPKNVPIVGASPFPHKHLPQSVDLRSHMTPVEHQGQTNAW